MTNDKRDSNGKTLQKRTQSELPDELWEIILSKLTLKDNIRASAANKIFLAIATLVRKTDKPPLLMLAPKCGDSYEFFDPFDHKSYWLDLPELRGARFHQTKDGWLLMSNTESEILFLFCPHTRELIQLPNIPLENRLYAFSAAPTSPSCMVFVLDRYDTEAIRISKCRPGDTEWTNVNYQPMIPLARVFWKDLIFCKGLLYCFDSNDVAESNDVAVIYNPEESSWTVQDIQNPGYLEFLCSEDCWLAELLGEYNGDIFKVFVLDDQSPVILKLDLPNRTWVEMETLGGNSLFISYSGSHVKTDLLGNKRNNVYLATVDFHENRCISYFFDEGKFLDKNQSYTWMGQNLLGSVWIDATEDLSTVK